MLRKNLLTAVNVTGGTANKLAGSVTATPGVVVDGGFVLLGSTITIAGAIVGDPVHVGVSIAMGPGLLAAGKVTSSNTVSIEIYNFSGNPVTIPSSVFTASVIH